MKKTAFAVLFAALASAATAGSAQAQVLPLSVEPRIDAGIPVGDTGDVLETGFGFGINASLHLTPTFALYGGWSRFELGFKDNLSLEDGADFEDDGFHLGGKVLLGTGGGVVMPYLQAGALFHEETGFEAGGGLMYSVGSNLAVTPAATYRKIENLEYVTLGVGLNLRL